MSYVKEARLTLAGDELKAVEATGVSFQDFAHDALREAVGTLVVRNARGAKRKKED